MTELTLRVGELRLHAWADQADLKLTVPDIARPFLCEPGPPPTISLAVRRGSPVEPRADRLLFSGTDTGLWEAYRGDDGGLIFRHGPRRAGQEAGVLLTVDGQMSRGEVVLNEAIYAAGRPHYPLPWPLDELLVVHLLNRGHGAQVHASGLALGDGRGVLFVGVSGAGKSTMTRWWRDDPAVTVLSDDRIVLAPRAGRWWMHGTPWHGTERLADASGSPLTAIFFLRQSDRTVARPITSLADRMLRLLPCSFPVPYDAAATGRTLDLLSRLVAQVPCYDLDNRRDGSAVTVVRECLQTG